MGSHLVDEFPHSILSLGPEFLGRLLQVLEAEGSTEGQGVSPAELDSAESHLDDVVSLVIRPDLQLILTTVKDVIQGFLEDGLVGGGEELLGLILGSEDDDSGLPGDGVDSEVLGEGHPGDRIGYHLLGGEGEGCEDDGDGGDDDAFHNVRCVFQLMSVDFRLAVEVKESGAPKKEPFDRNTEEATEDSL